MLEEKMYVRCPVDKESIVNPRVFVCGQITEVDEFNKTVNVKIHDPFSHLHFFENLPKGEIELPMEMVQHCNFFIGTVVLYKREKCKVLSHMKAKDGYYYYYLQNMVTKDTFRACEKNIIAAFNNGRVDPTEQLKKYEFQNPCWFLGHAIVSKSINILNNSIYGFKELAGSKIYLLAHQINTIMRCLQDDPCRYMLADEVGMGKTIEAISIFKIYMQERSNQKALVIVPETLKEQWKTELFLKFNIEIGSDKNSNSIEVKTIHEVNYLDKTKKWDFVIIDEVHRYLDSDSSYEILHQISLNTRNILLLSATPVQQRQEEYLKLLRLLLPNKYDEYTIEQFSILVKKQSNIIQKTALILDDLDDFEEEINSVIDDGENPHENEDCQDLFEEIKDGLEEICEELDDEKLTLLFEKIEFDDDDLGVYAVKVMISYICSNYQIESNIIRNRRKLLENCENEERLLPVRKLETITYDLDSDCNVYETVVYELLSDWIVKTTRDNEISVQKDIRPLLSSFFSSPWAFAEEIRKTEAKGIVLDNEILENTKKWISFEKEILDKVSEFIDDPDEYPEHYSTRLMCVLNAVYDEYFDQKIVLFTNYKETFEAYRIAMSNLFSSDEISFFGETLSKDDLELNAYRFQNDPECRIMLCDYTGGEGRNFQCADYIIHIDLPWDANMIEQRIGRLDRLERDVSRPVVNSVVVYTKETFEEALFDFWNNGLKIFNQSLSGMEIIMKEVNDQIVSAVKTDFKYGLVDKIPNIIKMAEEMRVAVRKEQNFDAAGFVYKPMYNELRRLIEYYAQNENELFANTMKNWASLAGFRGTHSKAGILTYSANSFSLQSAMNAMLIPPEWEKYINSSQNLFVNRVQHEYERQKTIKSQERSIRGTFIRKLAIENDYLHFFAPGDEVFDCIVENAMYSCKGQASAFAFPSYFNWIGIIYTWSVEPDFDYLFQNGVSIHAMSPYRNYMMSEQVVTPVALRNDDNILDGFIVREYARIIEKGFKPRDIIHLGKRTNSPGFLKGEIDGPNNVEWFKKEYSEENWEEIVKTTRIEASAKARDIFKRRLNIRGAREEMERTLSARMANSEYYGLTDEGIEKLQETQKILLEVMKRPKLILDSVAFVWMVRGDNE